MSHHSIYPLAGCSLWVKSRIPTILITRHSRHTFYISISVFIEFLLSFCLFLDKHSRILAPVDRLCGTAIRPGPLLAKLFGRDFLDTTSLARRQTDVIRSFFSYYIPFQFLVSGVGLPANNSKAPATTVSTASQGGGRIRTCNLQVMSLMSWPIPLPRFFPFSFFHYSHLGCLAGGIEPALSGLRTPVGAMKLTLLFEKVDILHFRFLTRVGSYIQSSRPHKSFKSFRLVRDRFTPRGAYTSRLSKFCSKTSSENLYREGFPAAQQFFHTNLAARRCYWHNNR